MRPEDLIQFNPPQELSIPQMQIPLNRPNPAMVPPEQAPPPQADPQLKREQRLGRYRDLIANFTYSLGKGMSAANANPRGQAQRTQAGIGAILTAPMELQEAQQAMRIQQQGADDSRSRVVLQQQQQDALSATEQRKQRAAAIMSEGGNTEEIFQRLIRAGLAIEALEFRKLAQDMENDQSLNKQRQSELEARTFNAAQGSVAQEFDLPGEVYPPRAPGAPMSQAPTVRADGLPSVQVGGQMLRPQSAQELQRAAIEKERQTQKLQQEFATPPKQTLEEQTAFQWLKDNPGKTLNDYQTLDANRRRPITNVFLNEQRRLGIENATESAPGQLVSKATGRPIPATQIPDARAARIEGLQTALQQADVVEQALLALGDTGAIKGFIESNGVYWPVVQDNLTPEQAAAVSETNRMLSAYAQAVSGLAVSEQEVERLKRSAPSIRMTPEANKAILGHFRRNAKNKLDNYLNLMGWEFKKEPTTEGGAVEEWERGPDGKLRRKQ